MSQPARRDFSTARNEAELGAVFQLLFEERDAAINKSDLAKVVDTKISTISNWLNGKVVPRDRDKVRLFLEALKVAEPEIQQVLVALDRLHDERRTLCASPPRRSVR